MLNKVRLSVELINIISRITEDNLHLKYQVSTERVGKVNSGWTFTVLMASDIFVLVQSELIPVFLDNL